MIRALLAGMILLVFLCVPPPHLLAQPASKPGSSASSGPPTVAPRAGTSDDSTLTVEDAHSPGPSYVLAFLGAALVLFIVCMPSRKG